MPYRQQTGVVVTDLADEIVLLDTNTKEMFSLNTIGRFIWHECIGHDLEFVVKQLISIYDVEPQVARNDVERILDDLLNNNLITHADESVNSAG